MKRLAWMLAGIAALLGLALPTGALIDRWATQNSVYQRIDNRFSALKLNVLRWSGKAPPDRPVDVAWRSKPTHLVSLQYLPIRLPNSDGTGGGLQGLPDGRIFYATAYGEFGYLTIDGTPITLPYRLEMNLEALKKHPVFTARNFHFNWIRVTDIDLKKIGEHQYELLVGHHYFDEARQCLEMRLSRGVIDGDSPDIGLVQPFKTIYRATHCLTFAGPERENAIDAYASGGRIVRLEAGKILFSLGDHNWAGVEGYPPLAAMDSSSLGKIIQIDLPSGAVRPFAKGVRNPQGLVLDSKGRLWETEHGPRGGDELNLIVEGGDYGWPQSTYGTDYGPRPWPLNPSQGRHLSGRPPQFSWSPSIGVSNLVEVTSGQFPEWQGDLLVASLANQSLRHLRLEGDRIVYDERIPFDGFRIRDITQLPDGRLAMITDQGYVVLLRNGSSSAPHPFLDASHQKPRSSDMSAEARERAVAGYYADPAHLASTTTADADPAVGRGRSLFGSLCATCHSLGSDTASSAPNLAGVVGRRVGSADYPYSDGLAGQSAAWTPQRIVEFASNPSGLYPGTVMQAVPVSGEHQKDLEAFFRANSPR